MKKIYAFILIIAFISFGCGKDKVKPSADSIMTQNAIQTIDVIKNAYQEKERITLEENLEPALSLEISKELAFEKAELSFAPRMVRISASNITVRLNWQGTWTIKGKTFKDRGVGILVFQRETMKLTRIDGDNPFLIPASSD